EAGDLDEIRVREVQVVAGHPAGEVVAESECKVEAVEAGLGDAVQVRRPEGAIVKPRLVFDLRDKRACDTADAVGTGLDQRGCEAKGRNWIVASTNAVCGLKHRVCNSA